MHVLFCVDGDGEKCPEGFTLDEASYCAGKYLLLISNNVNAIFKLELQLKQLIL